MSFEEVMDMGHSVLIVCTANICRSPMAMGLLRDKVSQLEGWRVESAGVWADQGRLAAANTRAVLRARGINIDNHRSAPVSREMLDTFRLILVMERNHKEALRAAFPQHAAQIYMLSEMIGREANIVDPIGQSMVDFEATAREIDVILTRGFDKISKLSEDQ